MIALEKCVYSTISSEYRNLGITLLELMANPFKRNRRNRKRGGYGVDSFVITYIVPIQRAMLMYPEISVDLVIKTDRDATKEMSVVVAKKAVKYKMENAVVGFDLPMYASKSRNNISRFYKAFEIARIGSWV